MTSHIKRLTIYLPTRILVVPCDYEPKSGKVDLVRVTMRTRFEIANPLWPEEVRQSTFAERTIEDKPEMTLFGAPIKYRDDE